MWGHHNWCLWAWALGEHAGDRGGCDAARRRLAGLEFWIVTNVRRFSLTPTKAFV